MPTTHALPPSLNYYCNVAHTAGDEEKAGRGGKRRKRKREGGRMADHHQAACVSCVGVAHGRRVFALRGVQRASRGGRGVGEEGTHSAPLEHSLAPPRGLARAAATPSPPSHQLPHPALPLFHNTSLSAPSPLSTGSSRGFS